MLSLNQFLSALCIFHYQAVDEISPTGFCLVILGGVKDVLGVSVTAMAA